MNNNLLLYQLNQKSKYDYLKNNKISNYKRRKIKLIK